MINDQSEATRICTIGSQIFVLACDLVLNGIVVQ